MKRLLLILLLAPLDGFAQRPEADLQCQFMGTGFVYDCTIRLSRGGQPLSGAQVTVGADMPSHPMVHNVRPVKAKPGKNPGEYLARLELDVHFGEWAVKLRLGGPVKDQLVLHYEFDERGARPVRRSGRSPRK